MRLIVGLGNPGGEYLKNRHNIGFMFIEHLVKELERCSAEEAEKLFTFDKYVDSEIANIDYDNQDIILAKPQTFMNKSGEAVSKLFKKLKLKVENLVVVHDDLDIPLGKFKIQIANGPKLHNGISSVEQHLKTKDFLRIRIGVDNRHTPIPGETYVLQDFTRDEQDQLVTTFSAIVNRLRIEKLI